jgi:hypothetical protein
MARATPPEIRKARSFLYSHHKRGFGIPPAKFASASKELGLSFRELMRFIAILYARGQGTGSFRMEALRNLASLPSK